MNNIIKYSLLILAIMFTSHLQAQNWSNGTSGTIYYNQGNVGIGTQSPRGKLDVNGRFYLGRSEIIDGWGRTYFNYDGHSLIIGTKPGQYSHNRFELRPGGADRGALFSLLELYHAASENNQELRIRLHSSGDTFFNGGNVGIGTTTPDSKLAVNGNIRAKEIKLETANWPDYVFDTDYQPMTLQETKAYIAQHGHLPGLKSAAEYEQQGVNMLELNQKLLEKIEELTLHAIEQQMEIDTLKVSNKKMELLEHKIELLSKLLKDE